MCLLDNLKLSELQIYKDALTVHQTGRGCRARKGPTL
jgi:hypothetical protein